MPVVPCKDRVREAMRGLCSDLLLNLACPSFQCRPMTFPIFSVGVVTFSVAITFSGGGASAFGGTIVIGLTKILSGASSTYDAFNLSAFGD
jgi:hypothetical protein